MSYDLAVWEGDVPSTDKAAAREFEELYERYFNESPRRPHGQIRAYVEELVEKWPEEEEGPWSTPLTESASGPIAYFSMVYSRADEVSEAAAQLAAEHGLVCFDPNRNILRGTHTGLTITTGNGRVALPGLWFAFVLKELREEDAFIIVDHGRPHSYAQARNVDGTLILEYRDGSPAKHYQATDVPLDQIADALSQWATGERQFIPRHTWHRLTFD